MYTKFFCLIIACVICFSVSLGGTHAQSKDELQAELDQIEAQIAVLEKQVAQTASQKKTLANKIAQLKKDQDRVTLQIRAAKLELERINKQLVVTSDTITKTKTKLEQIRDNIAATLRLIDVREGDSPFLALLGTESFSSMYQDLRSSESLFVRLNEDMKALGTTKLSLEAQQADLETKQDAKDTFIALQSLQQEELRSKAREQSTILEETKGREAEYQKILAANKKRADEIRSRIYELIGVTTQVTFGQAVEIAKYVSANTGVSPEFLLAILTQESNLGKNVGTCYVRNYDTGAGVSATTGAERVQVMNPTRDIPTFLEITESLGLDPASTRVSCPVYENGKPFGWGGAMGPAQFIPSTWKGYGPKVAEITGKPANPWDIRDAFLASAIYLKANGAAQNGRSGEQIAAQKYYCGGNWTRSQCVRYGKSVMALTKSYEDDIAALTP